MTNNRIRIGAVLLASVMALAMPLTAEAARVGGGGGGGGHFGGGGGGHFGGGGGGHFGGGGGHFGGGFGGGHFGGGGMRFGGGGMRFGGGHFGGFRLGGGGLHLGHGGLNMGRLHSGHGLSGGRGNLLAGQRALHGGRVAGLGAGALGTHALRSGALAHNNRFGGDRFGHNRFGGDRFGHNRFGGNRFGGGYGGWVGPVFWPYAYSDIYCGVFWGYWGYGCADPYWSYGYGNPFWNYGYDDIYGGIFPPVGFDDLTGSLASSQPRGRRSRSVASIPSDQNVPGQALSGQIAQMCGDDTKEVAGWPIDRMQQLVAPDDQQRMALDDLANASVKAAQIIKTACPTTVAFTPTGRLAAMQQRIEAMLQAADSVRGPLERFYGALTDEQKAKLSAANQTQAERNGRPRDSLAQNCTAANAAAQWPEARIEKAVRPNEAQLAKLNALQAAAAQSAEQLAASCPSEMPTTPPARLAAVAKRLDVMLQAVKSVRVALDDFYGTLNDEQKAQFNMIGPSPRIAQRQG